MLEISNLTKFAVDKKSFAQVAKKVLIGENREIENISLAFVGKTEIQKLNKKYRKKNKPTDVLSFNLDDPPSPRATAGRGKDYLGEIVICPDVVAENAKKFGVTIKHETIKVFVHGILHLLGYDHEKSKKEEERMESKQNLYLAKIR